MNELSVVCWCWGNKYSKQYVNSLRGMVKRHLNLPHKFYCITDDPTGLDEFVIPINIWDEFSNMKKQYRRLKILSKEMRQYFGDRILQIDLDMVITKNITSLVNINDEFKIWKSPSKSPRGFAYNTSFMLMDTGVMDHIYQSFRDHSQHIINDCTKQRWYGTDQAVISRFVDCKVPTWDTSDGIYSFRDHIVPAKKGLPNDSKIVGFYDKYDIHVCKEKHKWIGVHWRCMRHDIIDELINKYGWTSGAEIGVLDGSLHFHLVNRNPQLNLIGVDNWNQNHHYYKKYPLADYKKQVVEKSKSFKNSEIINKTSVEASSMIDDKSLDFVFIDADHSEKAVFEDIKCWTPKLKDTGWLMGHDFHMEGVANALKTLGIKFKKWPNYVWSIEKGALPCYQ